MVQRHNARLERAPRERSTVRIPPERSNRLEVIFPVCCDTSTVGRCSPEQIQLVWEKIGVNEGYLELILKLRSFLILKLRFEMFHENMGSIDTGIFDLGLVCSCD